MAFVPVVILAAAAVVEPCTGSTAFLHLWMQQACLQVCECVVVNERQAKAKPPPALLL